LKNGLRRELFEGQQLIIFGLLNFNLLREDERGKRPVGYLPQAKKGGV
jgi:hypothetical protein